MFREKEKDRDGDTLVEKESSEITTATDNTTQGHKPMGMASRDVADQMALYTKLMIMFCLFSECILSFTTFSFELFAIHGLTGFCIDLTCEYVVNRLSYIKFHAALCSILFGLILDSYLHRYRYLVIWGCGALLVCWPCLYLVIAYPVHWKTQESKKQSFFWASIFHGLTVTLHQIRVALVLERALDDHKVPNKRRFIGLLVFAEQLGQFLAGVALYICQGSRLLYSLLMCVNIVFCALYVVFWFFWARGFPLKDDTQFACVERAMVSSTCYILRKIDHKCCKGIAYEKGSDWQDYRCIHFSERTVANTWGFLTMLLVMLPLVGYFVTDAAASALNRMGLLTFRVIRLDIAAVASVIAADYLYLCLASNLHPTNREPFAYMSAKGGYFCVVYPLFEFVIFPCGKKLVRNEIVRLLFSIGIGAFLFGLTVAICAVIQQQTAPVEQDVINVLKGRKNEQFAHVVIVNLLDVDVFIRGEYFNRILVEPPNQWRKLTPFKPFKVLHVPMLNSPFNVSLYSDIFRLYDDYSFTLEESRFNWIVVHPIGMFVLPTGTFHQDPQIGVHPDMFGPAFVNVLCRTPVCRGVLEFRRNGRYHLRSFFPDKGKGDMGMKRFKLAGQYDVSFALVGNASSEIVLNVTFERLKVYLLVIKESSIDKYGISNGKMMVQLIQASTHRALTTIAVLNIPTFFHGLAIVLGQIALLEWLHIVCPRDLRSFIFSIPTFLSAITYGYFSKVGATALTTVGAIPLFSYACFIWILLIVYGVACLRYIQVWRQHHAPPPKKPHTRSVPTINHDPAGPATGSKDENTNHDERSRVKDKES